MELDMKTIVYLNVFLVAGGLVLLGCSHKTLQRKGGHRPSFLFWYMQKAFPELFYG